MITALMQSCSGLPSLVLTDDLKQIAPVGPKVAELIVNLKCEMWEAANSTDELPHYFDAFPLRDRWKERIATGQAQPATDDRIFNLRNIFSQIEYLGQAQFALEVTETGATNPGISYTNPIGTMAGSLALSVGGQLSETAHRQIKIDSSIDFARLVHHPDAPPKLAAIPGPCPKGPELRGKLGIKESLAAGLIASAMNDIAIFKEDDRTSGSGPDIDDNKAFPFGQVATTIDFTIEQDVNGGFILNLVRFSGGNAPLLSFGRKVIDTLAVTFIPVCIRPPFHTTDKKAPYRYSPPFARGTPGWANYLKPCAETPIARKANSVALATESNNTNVLQNILQGVFRR